MTPLQINSDGMSVQETMRHRFVTQDAVREMHDVGAITFVHKCRAPFRFDPTEKKVQFLAFKMVVGLSILIWLKGTGFKKQRVVLVAERTGRKLSQPDTTYSKLVA